MEKFFGKNGAKSSEDAEHWIGVSDLMSGLMIVFMFIAVSYMAYVHFERERIKKVAVSNQEAQLKIYSALNEEFSEDLPRWGATIDRDKLEFRFGSPEVLFVPGSSDLRPQFRQTLQEFFPRYIRVLQPYENDIQEIRIEGHTSSDWGGVTGDAAYFRNMELSQDRTRAALEFVQTLPSLSLEQRDWTQRRFAAIGYSSSRSIPDPETGLEDKEKSRRVNFRVLTQAEIDLRTIVEELRANQD